MCTAEGREEVVQGVFVGDIDRCQVEVYLAAVFVEEIVLADRRIKEIAGRDARRVLVVIASAGSRDSDQRRAVFRGRADCRQWVARGCLDAVAGKSSLKLFIRRETAQNHCRLAVERGGCGIAGAVGVVGERVVAGSCSGHHA